MFLKRSEMCRGNLSSSGGGFRRLESKIKISTRENISRGSVVVTLLIFLFLLREDTHRDIGRELRN